MVGNALGFASCAPRTGDAFTGVALLAAALLALGWVVGHEKEPFGAFISGIGIPTLVVQIMNCFSV